MMVAAAVWRIRKEVISALDERFGDPLDSYVNGSQVWVSEDDLPLEWRLHPVPGYERPRGVGTYEVFPHVALAVARGEEVELPWDGLEVFAAYDDEIEPAPLASVATAALGIHPDAWGLVDHDSIGDEWERTRGAISVVERLLTQLQG
jgi:hypothetical protein